MINIETIKKFCELYNIENYTINDKGEVSCNFVSIKNQPITKLPIKFDKVIDFRVQQCKLTTLEGCPRYVENFYCNNNNLTSLEFGPKECYTYSASNNNITSLEHSPNKVDNFFIDNNELTNFEGINFNRCVVLFVGRNKINDLKGIPISENYLLDHNEIESIDEYLSPYCNNLSIENNMIKSINCNIEISNTIMISGNPLPVELLNLNKEQLREFFIYNKDYGIFKDDMFNPKRLESLLKDSEVL